jgi:hypothetical protein
MGGGGGCAGAERAAAAVLSGNGGRMSDFLGRLAARALGAEVPLRARVPSRFEPEGAVVAEESPFSDPLFHAGEAGAARPGDLTPWPPLPSHTLPPGEGEPPPSLRAAESVLPVSSPGAPPGALPPIFQPPEGAPARSPGREPRGRGPLSLPEPSERATDDPLPPPPGAEMRGDTRSPGAHAPGYALTPPLGARSGGEARGFRVEGGLPERREKVDASPSEGGGSPLSRGQGCAMGEGARG